MHPQGIPQRKGQNNSKTQLQRNRGKFNDEKITVNKQPDLYYYVGYLEVCVD